MKKDDEETRTAFPDGPVAAVGRNGDGVARVVLGGGQGRQGGE